MPALTRSGSGSNQANTIDLTAEEELDEGWAVLREIEAANRANDTGGTKANGAAKGKEPKIEEDATHPQQQTEKEPPRPPWLPPTLHPTLEELPKWSLLADVLEEIEGEILRAEGGAALSLVC